jgi:protein-disulfide isomerase
MKTKTTKQKNSAQRLVLYTLCIVVLISGALFALHQINKKEQEAADASTVVDLSPQDLENVPMVGKKDAPLTIVEFGDYLCPMCKKFDETVMPQLKANYIDKGKLKLYFVDVFLHGEQSMRASLAAQTVLQKQPEAYWAFHSAIFQAQPKDEKTWVTPDLLSKLAQQTTKLDPQEVNKDTYMANMIQEQQLVNRLGVNTTPTILLNGHPLRSLDYDGISKELDQKLKELKK